MMSAMAKTLAGLFCICFLLSACNDTQRPVTSEEAKEFARQMEISIGKRDETFLNTAIETKTLIKRAGIPSGKRNNAFKRGLGTGMKFGTSLISGISKKATYTFIKEYEKNNTRHLLFRLYDEGSINYHDLELINSGGKTKIADIYIYVTGENFSETLRNLYLQFADEINGTTKNDDASQWLEKLPAIRSLINKGEYNEAMELFNEIPVRYRSGKIFQVMNVTISSGLTEEEYSTAIDEYNKFFPNEPNAALLMIDGHILHKDYDKALEAVNMLDRQINKDPLLDYYRYLCYNLLNEKEKAKQHIEQVVKNIPDFGDGLLELIAGYLEDHEYEKARPFVEKYKTKSDFDQASLDFLLLAYPDF